jgi:hypothetical protein
MVCLASVLVLDGARSAEGPEGTGVCGGCVCVGEGITVRLRQGTDAMYKKADDR